MPNFGKEGPARLESLVSSPPIRDLVSKEVDDVLIEPEVVSGLHESQSTCNPPMHA